MTTTMLLPIRMPDGRLLYASYKDEAEKERILDWARAQRAEVDPEDAAPTLWSQVA